MSNIIMESSESVDHTIKCVLYQNGWHISALSHCCRRKLPNSDWLLLLRYIPNLILDVFLKEKSQITKPDDLKDV